MGQVSGRFIPAGAGNTPAVRQRDDGGAVHPRWRGEHAKSEAVNGCIGFILAFRQAGSHQVTQALSGIAVPIVQQRADVVLGRAKLDR